jgi:hypothetical protein
MAGRYYGDHDHEGRYSGFGTFVWANGDKYTGEWAGGAMYGKGKMVWAHSGSIYEGQWEAGRMHGYGVKRTDESEYDGQWCDGCCSGHGVKTFVRGDRYDGQFYNDEREGFGEYRWAEGDRYIGMWFEGRAHGRGEKITAAGERHTGQFESGKANGLGIKTYVTGHVYVGEFIEEQMHGIGHIVLDTQEGQLSSWYEGQWKHDCADGYVNHQQRENGSNFHICCTPIAVLVRHGSVLVRCPRRLPKWLMMGSGVQVARMVRAVHVHT